LGVSLAVFSLPFSKQSSSPAFKGKVKIMLIQLPPNAILAHYKEQSPGVFAVVTPSGRVLGASFFAIHESFEFHSAINGAGAWVVLVPRSSLSSQSQANQPSLF
jgi:hypothetical protein